MENLVTPSEKEEGIALVGAAEMPFSRILTAADVEPGFGVLRGETASKHLSLCCSSSARRSAG